MRGSTDGAEGKTPKWRRVGLLLDDASGWSELLIPAYRFDRVRRRSGSEHYLLSRLSVEFRNSPPNAGPPSSSSLPLPHPLTTGSAVEVAGLDEIDNRGIKKNKKKAHCEWIYAASSCSWMMPACLTGIYFLLAFLQICSGNNHLLIMLFFSSPLYLTFFVKIGDRGVSK